MRGRKRQIPLPCKFILAGSGIFHCAPESVVLLLEAEAEGRDPESFLLPDEYGKVWTTARWRVVWENLLTDAGLESTLKIHELRHTAVSMAIAGGADVYVVQRMWGHATATTTLNSYGHLWDHGLDEAAEAIERHLATERKRVESLQSRRAQREKTVERGIYE